MTEYFVSGVPSGHGGAGDYLKIIKNRYPTFKYYYPKKTSSVNSLRLRFLLRVVSYIRNKGKILCLLFRPANSVVHIFHAQSLGYMLSALLVLRFKKIVYWHLDSSYFCIASYNHLPGYGVCVKCSNFNYKPSCRAFPVYVSWNMYNIFRKVLKKNIGKMTVVLQSTSNKELFEKIYGVVNFRLEPMVTEEVLTLVQQKTVETTCEEKTVVFHGNFLRAKGADDFIELSRRLPEWRFIVPGNNVGRDLLPKNIDFVDVNWGSGLQELCRQAAWIYVASDWSAPVEASLLKSVLCGRPLIVRSIPSSALGDFQLQNVIDLADGFESVVTNIKESSLQSYIDSLNDRQNVINYVKAGTI